MSEECTFLDFLREAPATEGRGNDEIVRAVAPLFAQVLEHHDEGRVAPLAEVGRVFAEGGHLWFHDADALAPTIALKELRAREHGAEGGLEIVDRTSVVIDLDERWHEVASKLVGTAGQKIEHPVYLPDYVSWEDEVGHHDALTDIFSLGMLMASLALGADFTEPAELERFVIHRRSLTTLVPALHPVIAKAIVRMTELDRHARAQDLRGLEERIKRYREVDDRVDRDVDFRRLEGFVQADRSSRRKIIQSHLQSRLFDTTRRNRLIYYRPTLSTLDLTEASVPTQLHVERVQPQDLFSWQGGLEKALSSRSTLRLERYLRLEETPYARGVLDKIRAEARRDEAELGASPLRLVIAFLNWHDLRNAPDERVRSPLLLLPVTLDKKRGVRDGYELTPASDLAEVNPVLRHVLHQLYELELPERVDLGQTDIETFHKAIAAEIVRSEPGITVRLLKKPQIRIVHERARRRLAAWRRRSKVSGRGVRRFGDVSYSYSRTNFQPLGLELFLQKVKPEILAVAEHLERARARAPEPSLESDEGAPPIDVRETERTVFEITEGATGRFDWAVDLTHLTLGNFNYRTMSLVRDFDEILAEEDGHERPAFDALFSLDAREIAAPPTSGLDPFEPFVVVPADPTQTSALHWAREGKDFIIQGPPGTGKSQTITNLIADFAGRGKRVLFVCQKRAALDVVYHRLAQHGLDELCVLIHDSQADKKPFLTELGATYQRWLATLDAKGAASASDRRAALKSKLAEPLEALSRFSSSMGALGAGASKSVAALLRERLESGPAPELSAQERERVPAHAAWASARSEIHALGRALKEIGESEVLSELPLLALGTKALEAERPIAMLRDALDTIEAQLAAVDQARELVRPGATAGDLREALALAEEVGDLAERGQLALLDAESDRSRELDALLARRGERARTLEKARGKTEGWARKLARTDLSPALALARRFDAIFVLFLFFLPGWWRLRAVLRSHYDFAKHTVRPGWVAVLEELADEYDEEDGLSAIEAEVRSTFRIEGELDAFSGRLAELRGSTGRAPLQIELRAEWSTGRGEVVSALRAASEQIAALSRSVSEVFDDAPSLAIEALAERIRATREAIDLLPELRRPLLELGGAGGDVRAAMRALPLTAEQLEAAVTDVALERTFRENRPLARFDHAALERRRGELAQRHGGWLEANAEAVREGVRARFLDHVRLCSMPAANLTQEQKERKRIYNAGRRVLEREFEKIMRHRSIRELSSGESGAVLYDLKPIWLMSPLSISDTIPLAEERFDVVIFDEASQIPLEEAVPALYRAPQMIVVGDEMQLPPTSFFAAKREDEEALEESRYDLDADSFLTHAARRLPSTMLGWHYRSRSEALIRFSNHAFYDGELLTVPDRHLTPRREPIEVSGPIEGDVNAAFVVDRPVSFHHLGRGVYESRRNSAEAAYIARLVRGLLARNERYSIGIVAFSEAQQGEIESALEALASEDDAFCAALEAENEREEDGQLVGLFVKNLENVQGDERDVIILSICYGPDASGKMRMNFGPINQGGGEKRLNVVFSRTKRHMVVVSSIRHSAIGNEYNEGARCLRRYLQYAAALSTGDVDTASIVTHVLGRGGGSRSAEPTKDVVVEGLAAALEERGYLVQRDIGASDFRVDAGVSRPDDPALCVAVLVDTERHYAEGDPMERYHTRPAVLEAFGWRLEWVLAKDWVADADACVARIERAYHAARDLSKAR